MLLPWSVYTVLSDGRRVLVARFANKTYADDFVEYQATVSDEQFETKRELTE